MLPASWWDRWLDPTVQGTQELVDAAVQAALRGKGPELIDLVD